MATLTVISSGIHSLLQDEGRFGQQQIGLTHGGPMDRSCFRWANRLVNNTEQATAIEITVGGLKVTASQDVKLAVAGPPVELKITGKNSRSVSSWQSFTLYAGEQLEFGYATQGVRSYLAIKGGLQIPPQFGSTSTVVRESIGGLSGKALQKGDELAFDHTLNHDATDVMLPDRMRPEHIQNLSEFISLRVIPGYQVAHFSRDQQRKFFQNSYQVTELCDRMGFRLQGPAIQCDLQSMLSEGICLGAIQIPADGQPIILMNDRQTIGGYPKLGAVLSLDLAKLAQASQGTYINFEAISIDHAHNLLALSDFKFNNTTLREVT
jgi:biotin-dependent carboxylase-like uncharacterized protein